MSRDARLAHPRDWMIYIITDERFARGRTHAEVAEAAIAGGADAVQLRDKGGDLRRLREQGMAIRELTRKAGVAFIVNDRVDLALAVDADGVHVGSSDTAPAVARSLIGRERLLGVSVSGAGLAVDPDAGDPDYLGVGPVFEARTTKPDAAGPGGLALVRRVAVWTQRPIVAIGGITESNAASVIQAGAGCVAVISAVVGAEDIAAATRRLRALVAAARATDP